MKRIAIAIFAGMTLAALLAAEATPPVITDAHKAAFFKQQLALERATEAFQLAQQVLATVRADMTKDCGDKFQPQLDASGDPVCAAKPTLKTEPKGK